MVKIRKRSLWGDALNFGGCDRYELRELRGHSGIGYT